MPDNQWFRKHILAIKSEKKLTQKEIADQLGITDRYLSGVINGKLPLTESLISLFVLKFHIQDENIQDSLINVNPDNNHLTNGLIHYIRLLPISASGGSLNEFVMSVKESDCEKIISPIKGVDFAITVTGHSMEPEYPAGSQILIKKIDESQFIEWGRCYCLDTCNGVVIKKLIKGEPGVYHCVSTNPDQDKYAPFDIPVEAVSGIYRVLMIMSMK